MFGGRYLDYPPGSFGYERKYTDTWVYSSDGVNGFWERQTQATNAPHRYGHGMIWDSSNRVVLVHGGVAASDGLNESTWSWNGTNWSSVVSGPPVWGFGIAFDTERAIAIIYGGFPQRGEVGRTPAVWEKGPTSEWINTGWGPPGRGHPAMAYDERRKRVVLVGGVGESIETGESAYEYIPGTGWLTIPSLPSGQGRAGAKMVYDSKRGVMVLTGGAGGGAPNASSGGRYSDTWELWPSLFISGQPTHITNIVCGTALLSSFVQGVGPFQYTWRLDGAPLSDNTHYSGSQTADLRINGLRYAHAGHYDVAVRDNCSPQNVVTSKVATLTVEPGSDWVLRATSGPPARFAHAMAYDKARRVTVLFGGRTNLNGMFPLNDLWEWDGAQWKLRMENSISNGWMFSNETGWQVTHSNQPVRRANFAMTYDSRRGRVILFGGQGITPDNSPINLRDLWEWDGTQWHFRGTNGPVARFHGSMAFDERRGRTVLFGGRPIPQPGEVADEELVWEWDGERWHTNQPPQNPSASNSRSQARMTYDRFRGVIVFGPTYESYSHWAFWDWDGAKWTNFPVLHFTDPVVSALHGTVSGGFAFDSNRRRSVWFGGQNIGVDNKTAFFDGKHWTLLNNSSPPPPARTLPAMVYDSDRRVVVMFGGSLATSGAEGATNDTWELMAVDVPLINGHPASQYRLAGETATFSAQVARPSSVTYQWYRGNTPIPGASGPTFTIAEVRGACRRI